MVSYTEGQAALPALSLFPAAGTSDARLQRTDLEIALFAAAVSHKFEIFNYITNKLLMQKNNGGRIVGYWVLID